MTNPMNRREFTRQATGAVAALAVGGAVVAGKAEAKQVPVVVPPKKDLEQRAAEWFYDQLGSLFLEAGTPEIIIAKTSETGIPRLAEALRNRKASTIMIPWLPPVKPQWVPEVRADDPDRIAMFANATFTFTGSREVHVQMAWRKGNVRWATIWEPA